MKYFAWEYTEELKYFGVTNFFFELVVNLVDELKDEITGQTKATVGAFLQFFKYVLQIF